MEEELKRIMGDLSNLHRDFTRARKNGAVENLNKKEFDEVTNRITEAWVHLERIRLILIGEVI